MLLHWLTSTKRLTCSSPWLATQAGQKSHRSSFQVKLLLIVLTSVPECSIWRNRPSSMTSANMVSLENSHLYLYDWIPEMRSTTHTHPHFPCTRGQDPDTWADWQHSIGTLAWSRISTTSVWNCEAMQDPHMWWVVPREWKVFQRISKSIPATYHCEWWRVPSVSLTPGWPGMWCQQNCSYQLVNCSI